MSFLALLSKPARRNLVEVVTKLPDLGVGAKVTRNSWEQFGNSYWEITRVRPREDGKRGSVWGHKVWKGERVTTEPVRVNGSAKRIWRWVPSLEEAARYREVMHQIKAAERQAARVAADAAPAKA